jgi:hypothetical protein
VERGYGHSTNESEDTGHDLVDAGLGEPWDLDHTDDRTGYRGPAHSSHNREAGARRGNERFLDGRRLTPRLRFS